MTSVKKRLDHILTELDTIGNNPDEKTAKNIIAELQIVQNAYHQTQNAPMCCFHLDQNKNITCDAIGPLSPEEFMQACKACQEQIRQILTKLIA